MTQCDPVEVLLGGTLKLWQTSSSTWRHVEELPNLQVCRST